MRFALRIVSMREVAETMCEEPAVREVYRKRRGSSSSSFRLNVAAMLGWWYVAVGCTWDSRGSEGSVTAQIC